jgi:hypothetical protein
MCRAESSRVELCRVKSSRVVSCGVESSRVKLTNNLQRQIHLFRVEFFSTSLTQRKQIIVECRVWYNFAAT